ncbi:MAG TPA: hypothetical protein VN025_04805 [Candidatus Dormibacteraeota bacterium]|nr:hypothetical protein [Candidatus Dormibacteraeota bacterium]
MLMLALYRRLLYLYPAGYRCKYGEEMAWVFQQAHAEITKGRVFARAEFCAREIGGLLFGSVREQVRRLSNSYDWMSREGGSMESKFRFPRATVFLMLLSLAGVVLSLEEARAIQIHYGVGSSIPPEWPAMLWIFGRLLLIAAATAGIVWGIFFALRRTGVHRLAELKPWREQK